MHMLLLHKNRRPHTGKNLGCLISTLMFAKITTLTERSRWARLLPSPIQCDESESDIWSVLLQIYSEGKTLPVPRRQQQLRSAASMPCVLAEVPDWSGLPDCLTVNL